MGRVEWTWEDKRNDKEEESCLRGRNRENNRAAFSFCLYVVRNIETWILITIDLFLEFAFQLVMYGFYEIKIDNSNDYCSLFLVLNQFSLLLYNPWLPFFFFPGSPFFWISYSLLYNKHMNFVDWDSVSLYESCNFCDYVSSCGKAAKALSIIASFAIFRSCLLVVPRLGLLLEGFAHVTYLDSRPTKLYLI